MGIRMILRVSSQVNHLFEDSKFFLEQAKSQGGRDRRKWRRNIRTSIITAFAALEALVNTLLCVLDEGNDLELAERAFVREKRVELAKDGYLELGEQQFRSLEQKIRFLHWRIKGTRLPKGNVVWKSLIVATRVRNNLVHPRPGPVSNSSLTVSVAESCLTATQEIAELLGWTEQ